MKKLLALLLLSASSIYADEIVAWEPKTNNRIAELRDEYVGSSCEYGVYIIEYEGVKYIVHVTGGIVRHDPKPQK